MATNDYLPHREPEFIPWFNNFNTKLPTYETTLDLKPEDLTTAAADTAVIEFAINGVEAYKSEKKEWVDFKNLELYGPTGEPTPAVPAPPDFGTPPTTVAPNIISRTRDLVRRIKAHPNYTEAIGEDLGLIGSEQTERDEAKPDGNAKPLPKFKAEVSFVKRGFDGVDIESRRGSETEWGQLAFDAFSPYTDTREPLTKGQVEERHYRLRYRRNDEPIGQYSDTFTVTVGP